MNLSIYLHIPFCTKRCSYCDFNTYAGLENIISTYVQALCREIEILGKKLPDSYRNKVHTIYFGGGTPSLLRPEEIKAILTFLKWHFGFTSDLEITLEANPGTLNLAKVEGYGEVGVNRLSIGFQAANERELQLLGRLHTLEDVVEAVRIARLAGVRNLNLDLIYGLPGQKLADWKNTLQVALSLQVEHLSLYSLTIEEGTLMDEWIRGGKLPYPDGDFAADCYELAREMLAQYGYIHYEISNWAKPGEYGLNFCRHNLQYWKNREYVGLGAGAHGFVGGFRLANVLHPIQYIQKLSAPSNNDFPFTPATDNSRGVDREEEMKDTVMLGLRLVQDGVGDEDFYQRFGVRLKEVFPREITKLLRKGLVEWIATDQPRLRLTRFGQLLANQAFLEFV
ncbi:MAG: hypothetical protein ANABAC_0387 [Anaerolineae bacterium]|jgi:oxygen-independent coproporphyrinogen-3 oxidase|nr:MAG: hypothetical protein ANABAC_0387 [Anaerolineae bacterium]